MLPRARCTGLGQSVSTSSRDGQGRRAGGARLPEPACTARPRHLRRAGTDHARASTGSLVLVGRPPTVAHGCGTLGTARVGRPIRRAPPGHCAGRRMGDALPFVRGRRPRGPKRQPDPAHARSVRPVLGVQRPTRPTGDHGGERVGRNAVHDGGAQVLHVQRRRTSPRSRAPVQGPRQARADAADDKFAGRRRASDASTGRAIARFPCHRTSKLAGNPLANFASFLSRSWRRHDFEWGRADAGAALIQVLPTSIQTDRRRIRTRIQKVLDKVLGRTRNKIQSMYATLDGGNRHCRPAARGCSRWSPGGVWAPNGALAVTGSATKDDEPRPPPAARPTPRWCGEPGAIRAASSCARSWSCIP